MVGLDGGRGLDKQKVRKGRKGVAGREGKVAPDDPASWCSPPETGLSP